MRCHARTHLLLAVLVFFSITPSGARSDTVTFDFSSLSADAGQVVDGVTLTSGPLSLTISDSLVVGPGDAGYTGQVGIIPQATTTTLHLSEQVGGVAVPFSAHSISADFAPGTNGDLDWSGTDGTGVFAWTWTGTIATTTTALIEQSPGYFTFDYADINANAGSGVQILSLAVDLQPVIDGGTPEPSGLLLLGVGASCAGLACRRLRGRG